MKVVWSWLSELVELENDRAAVETVARQLTMAGLEVEEVVDAAVAGDGCVVARIESVRPHPRADRLKLVTVATGDDAAAVEVVCGAPNCAPGALVVLAPTGVTLAGGLEVKEVEIRGVRSSGMLVSERELGISDDHEGLVILDPELDQTRVGMPLSELIPLEDWVLTLGVTPNRPDWMSHVGVAREIGAITGATFTPPSPPSADEAGASSQDVAVTIEDPQGCPRYAGYLLEQIRPGAAPLRMRRQLLLAGVRPISNVVDVTNYVNLELGHPQHAFDLEKLAGQEVRVRRAHPGEKLRTLDDVERELTIDDLVIADGERAMALAGIMGGGESEVTDATGRVLLETATFDPITVRRSSKRHGLRTESSVRFERAVDSEGIVRAADRAVELLRRVAGARLVAARDAHPRPVERRSVALRVARCNGLLGTDLSPARMQLHLERLGCTVAAGSPQGSPEAILTVSPPTFRPDLEREVDLIEEVARVEGYQNVAEAPDRPTLSARAPSELLAPMHEMAAVRESLQGLGFHEAVHFGFTSDGVLDSVVGEGGKPAARVRLQNPLSSEHSVMRDSLIPQLLHNARENLKHEPGVWIFEVGAVFSPDPAAAGDSHHKRRRPPVHEGLRLVAFAAGSRPTATLDTTRATLADIKGAVESALEALGLRSGWRAADRWRYGPCELPWLDGTSAASIQIGTEVVAGFGPVSAGVLLDWELEVPAFAVEIDLDRALALAAGRRPGFRAFSRYPGSQRDVAFVLDADVSSHRVLVAMNPDAEALLADVYVFDEYRGEGLEEGKKSLAYRLCYEAPDRTVTKEEVDEAHEALVRNVCDTLGARVR